VIAIEEQSTGSFNAGVGYSQIDGANFTLGVTERNVLGSGYRANLNASFSKSTKSLDLGVTNPFFTNKQLEIVKNPELFFFDMGLRNVLIKNFSALEDRVDKGAMLENFVFRELVERDLKYYRTKNGAEVDFILDDRIPIEIKSNLSTIKISKSYHYFLENYKPKVGYVLNFNQIGHRDFNGIEIKFFPHFLAKII